MLIDGISRRQLRKLAITTLAAAGTLAGDRVFEARDWPTRPELFPLLLVQTPIDRQVSIFPGSPQFTTTIHLMILGRVVGLTSEQVEDDLDTLTDQIENSLLFSAAFADFIQQFATIETQTRVTAEAKQQMGEISMAFELVVYQVFGPDGPDLTDIVSTLQPGPPEAASPLITIEAKA